MKIQRLSYLLLALTLGRGLLLAQQPAAGSLEPHLLLAPADFDRINALAHAEPWAEKIRAEIIHAAETWPAQQLQKFGLKEWAPPAEGGSWGADYVCPDDGARLQFSIGHNRCPRCGKDYHGWPYDYEPFAARHGENSGAVRDLGLAYRLTGKAAFAAKARVILLAYAKLYPTMPIRSHKDWPKEGSHSGARITTQTLSESDWVLTMAFGYDLVRATLSAEERALVERDLLRSGSDVIARRERSLGNWTARQNEAHVAVGLLLHDQALIDLGLNAEFGFRDDMRRGVTADGPWHEGSWGYHFYVMSPLFMIREMAARAGLAIPEAENLRKMIDAPLACVLPDGTMPNFNDDGFTTLSTEAHFYDTGYRLFGDRRYLRIVRSAPRGLEALLWGAPKVDEGSVPELGSSVMPVAGFATLRSPGTDDMIAIKFGEHGGGHGHFDKLNFVSFANGHRQAVDPGSQSYAYKTHGTWDRMTIAHNTVTVDETTQAAATGKLLEWHDDKIATAIHIEAGAVYPGAQLTRWMIHTAGYTLDVFEARATDGAAHQFDWIYHNNGTETTPLTLTPYTALPAKNGYQHLADPRAITTASSWEATFAQDGGKMRLQMLGTEGTTVVLGTGLGQDLTVPVPFAMARRRGTEARFISVLEPYRDAPRVQRVSLVRPDVVEVVSPDGVDEISLATGQFNFTRSPVSVSKP